MSRRRAELELFCSRLKRQIVLSIDDTIRDLEVIEQSVDLKFEIPVISGCLFAWMDSKKEIE